MRLFYAIAFDPKTQHAISDVAGHLRGLGATGRWVGESNLHLTLVFIGETRPLQLGLLHDILQQAAGQVAPFTLQLDGYGVFGRQNDILWIGVRNEPQLQTLANALQKALQQHFSGIDTRPYKPHVTLARQVHLPPESLTWQGPPILCDISSVVLMESVRLEGGLRYRPVRQIQLDSTAQDSLGQRQA